LVIKYNYEINKLGKNNIKKHEKIKNQIKKWFEQKKV